MKIGQPGKESKEGDGGFQPRIEEEYNEPSVVVEVGISETANELRRDMAWWFACDKVRYI